MGAPRHRRHGQPRQGIAQRAKGSLRNRGAFARARGRKTGRTEGWMISAQEAIVRLKEGNERFVSGNPLLESLANPERRSELASGQEPFAIILGCSDSRVPSRLFLTSASATCLSSAWPATSSRHRRSAASSTPRPSSARDWSWCWGTRIAAPSRRQSASCDSQAKIGHQISARSSTGFARRWSR